MPTTMEKQFNVWSVQEQLSEFSTQRQLEMNLKALRDQHINELMIEKSIVLFNSKIPEEKIKLKTSRRPKCIIL
jgi:hypothetical protein